MLAASSLWQCGRTKRRRFHLCIMCCDTVFPNPSVYWVLVLNQRRPASSSFLLASLPPPSAPPVLSSPCLCSPYVFALARLSRVSWPHRELHRRSQWVFPHAPPPHPFRHISHTFRGLIIRGLHRRPHWARPHVDAPTGAFGGAPYGATKRGRGVPDGTRVTMRTPPLGPSVELPTGPRNV